MYRSTKHQDVGGRAAPGMFYDNNKSCELTGSGYQGRITGNRNANVHCENATVEMLDNRNVNAQIYDSNVTAIEESNFELLARASKIEMKSNRNINVRAEGAWCKFENNGNLEFEGGGGVKGASDYLSQFVENKNSKFRGTGNNILAFKNKNLSIAGDNNRLEISNTYNHDVRPAATESNR